MCINVSASKYLFFSPGDDCPDPYEDLKGRRKWYLFLLLF